MYENVHMIVWDLLVKHYDFSNIYVDVIVAEIGAMPFIYLFILIFISYKVLLNGLGCFHQG